MVDYGPEAELLAEIQDGDLLDGISSSYPFYFYRERGSRPGGAAGAVGIKRPESPLGLWAGRTAAVRGGGHTRYGPYPPSEVTLF